MQIPKSEEEKIKKVVNQAFIGLAEAAKSLDVGEYIKFFNKEKFTALNVDGTVTHSFEDFENTYREQISALEKYQSLEFINVKITVINANTAILVNEYKADVLLKSGDVYSGEGGGTQVWSKSNDGWKLVSVSSGLKPIPSNHQLKIKKVK